MPSRYEVMAKGLKGTEPKLSIADQLMRAVKASDEGVTAVKKLGRPNKRSPWVQTEKGVLEKRLGISASVTGHHKPGVTIPLEFTDMRPDDKEYIMHFSVKVTAEQIEGLLKG